MESSNPLDCKTLVPSYFSKWDTETYRVPYLHFNRLPYRNAEAPGSNLAVLEISSRPPTPSESQAASTSADSELAEAPARAAERSESSVSDSCTTPETDGHPPAARQDVSHSSCADFKSEEEAAEVERDTGWAGSKPGPVVERRTGRKASARVCEAVKTSLEAPGAACERPPPVLQPRPTRQPRAPNHKGRKKKLEPAPPSVIYPGNAKQTRDYHYSLSDFTDDFVQDFVVTHLYDLGKAREEPMFILSQFVIGNYLKGKAATTGSSLADSNKDQSRGEIDVFVLHRTHGVLLGEIKSVGSWPGKGDPAEQDAHVAKRLKKAVNQLDKLEKQVRYAVSDVIEELAICKTVFLPNVDTCQLKRVLSSDNELRELLGQCLGAKDIDESVALCVCEDQLPDQDDHRNGPQCDLTKLGNWWELRMAQQKDRMLCGAEGKDKYLTILSRFIGPASTVSVHCTVSPPLEIRTAGEGIKELGRRLSQLVLTPEQMDLLHRNRPRVCVTGPPGTGKTIVMVLQALRWLLEGHDVHIVSTRCASFAASLMIEQQLKVTLSSQFGGQPVGQVEVHRFDFFYRLEDVNEACSKIPALAKDSALHVIMDEVAYINRQVAAPRTQRLVDTLIEKVPDLRFWCACVSHINIPKHLTEETLNVPLRCAPSVIKEVKKGFTENQSFRPYRETILPAPGDGPPARYLQHHGDNHTMPWPVQCGTCAHLIAEQLRSLDVGLEGSRLRWSDVFIVTRSIELQDDVRDGDGNVTKEACGFVRALRGMGVPVCVLGMDEAHRDRASWEEKAGQVARAETNEVTVADFGCVLGLERCVVVWLVGRVGGGLDEGVSDRDLEAQDRVYLASRCTTHLIVVACQP